jgi:hypothetical protein
MSAMKLARNANHQKTNEEQKPYGSKKYPEVKTYRI